MPCQLLVWIFDAIFRVKQTKHFASKVAKMRAFSKNKKKCLNAISSEFYRIFNLHA